MTAALAHQVVVAAGMGLLGAVLFGLIGLVSGTDETTTIAPVTLLVVLLGTPPTAVFTFWLAAAISKHMTHAIPTALLGIPGDTLAVPMMQQATAMRDLGAPHVALRKMISGGIVAAVIAVPLAVAFALLLAPFGAAITRAAPWIFLAAAAAVAFLSPGRWASVAALVPFVLLIVALRAVGHEAGLKLGVSYFLGIAVGPLVADLFTALSPGGRAPMLRDRPRSFVLAPEIRAWGGWFPNPLRVLDRTQRRWVLGTAAVSSATFMFSPVAMTVVLGELVGARIGHSYHRLTTVLAARNGVSEATYIAEALIPLIAFGLPLSPVAAGPAAPLFSAPPVYTLEGGAHGAVRNLHTLMSAPQFLCYGLLAVALAGLVAYPFAMNHARSAAAFVARSIGHEAIIATFVGLVLVIGAWEGGMLAVLTILTVALVGGLLNRAFGLNSGVQFMGYYAAVLSVPALVRLWG